MQFPGSDLLSQHHLFSLLLGEIAYGRANRPELAFSQLSIFVVWEATADDLNGDGDALDAVWHRYDGREAIVTNLRVAASLVCRASLTPDLSCAAVAPVVDRTLAALMVSERANGEADLNGDGDMDDDVVYAYNGRTHTGTVVPLALGKGVGRDLSSYTFPLPPVIAGDSVAFLVGEAEHGGLDLNGDGDALDDVLHIMEFDTGATVSVGFAAATVTGPFGSRNPIAPVVSGQKVTIVVGELEQGNSDLNGDGDADDQVSIDIHVRTGRAKIEK